VHYSELNQEWHLKSKTVAEIESNLNKASKQDVELQFELQVVRHSSDNL